MFVKHWCPWCIGNYVQFESPDAHITPSRYFEVYKRANCLPFMLNFHIYFSLWIHLKETAWRINREYTNDLWNIRLSDKGLLYFKSGLIIFGLGLTNIWWDSPFSKVMSPGTHHFRNLVRTLVRQKNVGVPDQMSDRNYKKISIWWIKRSRI